VRNHNYDSFDVSQVWLNHLQHALLYGEYYRETREHLGASIVFDAERPVVCCKSRKANYRFMAAEAAYIIQGRNDVGFLSSVMSSFTRYSDDGYFQSGAYGPPFVEQLPYVLQNLAEDKLSRQAVITIWRPRPFKSLDTPCTISLQFIVRDDALHTIVNMRSSDIFTGLVYDTFCFAVMGAMAAYLAGVARLGKVQVHAGSAHVYERDATRATQVVNNPGIYRDANHVLEPDHPDSLNHWLHNAYSTDSSDEAFDVLAHGIDAG
jgi:hypothetical protein